MPIMEDIKGRRGQDARGSDGDTLGKIEDVYLARETGEPEWAAVKTALFGGHVSFGPLAEARLDSGAVAVAYDKAKLKAAPHADADGQLSEQWRKADMSDDGPRSPGPAGGRGTRGYGF